MIEWFNQCSTGLAVLGRWLGAAAIAGSCLFSATAALADESEARFAEAPEAAPAPPASDAPCVAEDAPAPAARRAEGRWYGYETLTLDGAATGMLVYAAGRGAPAVGTGGALAYLLGGPVVHWSHGRGLAGATSLALRGGLPAAGALLGALAGAAVTRGDGRGSEDVPPGAVLGAAGLMAGMAAAVALDAALLARDSVRAEDAPAPEAKRDAAPVTLRPDLDVQRARATLGLRGAF